MYIQRTAYELRLTCVQGCVGEIVLTSGEGRSSERHHTPSPRARPYERIDTLSSRARECVVRVPGAAAETREQRGSAEEQQRWGLRGLWPWAVGAGGHPGQRVCVLACGLWGKHTPKALTHTRKTLVCSEPREIGK